ncbi:hypothetical protein N657DRAFT_693482 [Parathielavia appendiculata]|uniref:Uncharacterized protein n=1 Tax=Parathielavia appendiculata TaxID=2587402 RepID=A0AAN6TTR3_9PEZI|nr:hypothetical protein N657DRAFT_693482 [Parathielavia appendiculata]
MPFGPETFNIKYDTGIFSRERHRIQLIGCYLGLAFTGAKPAEFVDGERKSGKDRCLEELFPRHAIGSLPRDEDKGSDDVTNQPYVQAQWGTRQNCRNRTRPTR